MMEEIRWENLAVLAFGLTPVIVVAGVISSEEAAKAVRPPRKEISEKDREFILDELAWLAEWIKERYPEMDYGEIARFLREMIAVSVA